MSMDPRVVVFVHGWSVSNTDTYGQFPARLEREAQRVAGLNLDTHHIWLGKYVSFKDQVRVEDLARGFQAAVERELRPRLGPAGRFVCITHSTGGPVIREWLDRNYSPKKRGKACPMSHLIMLAPANFGSALAQLGKGRISSLKSWFGGVEPGKQVLDWLELGSSQSWDLNKNWMEYPGDFSTMRGGVFPFVLTGQSIDRSLFDHVNSYTGETGSDGVVRVAAANLNATYVRLEQDTPTEQQASNPNSILKLRLAGKSQTSPTTAFGLVSGRSHSGEDIGILASVRDDNRSHPSVTNVLRCLMVGSQAQYRRVAKELLDEVAKVSRKELVEIHDRILLKDTYTIHDPHSMVIVRLQDDRGCPIEDFDLKFTGQHHSPDTLPPGFLVDRQRNSRHPGTVTFFLNYSRMRGAPAIRRKIGRKTKTIREKLPSTSELGFHIIPRPRDGYVHYLMADLQSSRATLEQFVKPHQTTMVDIELKRIVHRGVFELTQDRGPDDFRDQPQGSQIE